MELNRLTQDLYAAGYTRERHPDFVYWSNWQNFGYRWEAMLKFTWETPCGLLVRGDSDLGRGLAAGDASYGGVCYCPENDNPLLLCPYEKRDCPHIPQGFPRPFCPCRCTGRFYEYDQSAERVKAERTRESHRQYMELTGGAYCACVVGNNSDHSGRLEVRYDVEQCIRCRCKNEVCVIRKEKRDLRRANVFYDIRRTWITRTGFLEEKKVELTKGVKVFPRFVAWTDAEIWLRTKQVEYDPLHSRSVIEPQMTPQDRQQAFFSRMHRQYGTYDYFEFHYEVENIRIAQSERRDRVRDLRDALSGAEVVHDADLKKAAADQKREARRQRREQRQRRKTHWTQAEAGGEQLALYGDRAVEI